MSAQIALEAAWRVPALRYGPRRWRPLEADGHLPIHWYMKAEQLAVVQGWDDTRATLRRWNANPWPRAPHLGARLARRDRDAADADLDRRRDHAGRPDRDGYPGLTPPATLHDFGFLLLPQRPRARAARAGLRRGLHRRLAAADRAARLHRGLRKLHDRAGTAAIAFVAAATLFSLGTPGLRARQRRRVALRAARRLAGRAAASRCCRTRCRSCSRSSCRSPRGRWRAARARGTSCWPRRSPRPRSRSRCSCWPRRSRPGSRLTSSAGLSHSYTF